MPQTTRIDRVRGCLLGLAIGDALGAPHEGLGSQQIRAHYHLVTDYVDGARAWKKKPYRWRLPGLYTDDTQQALALADVVLARGVVDLDYLAAIYLDMATPEDGYAGAHRGVGRSFRQVLADLRRGVSPELTGQTSAGIGAAMRIAPLALYFSENADALHDAVFAASLMTHRDVRSITGAMAVASTVRRILAGEPRDASLLFRVAADVHRAETRIKAEAGDRVVSLPAHAHSMSQAIAKTEALLDIPRDRAFASLVEEANRHGAEPVCRRATMGFPPACIPTCLYLFLTTDNFEDVLIEVVNLGGDADSTGAILGSMAGAYYGVEAIPNRWLIGLQNRDGVDARAHALANRSAHGIDIPDLIATEQVLSKRENDCRDHLMSSPPRSNGGDLGANRLV